MQGRFITFEGGEGVGKSTQVANLCENLHKSGQAFIRTFEPGGTKNALAIRQLLVQGNKDRWDWDCELLLFVAARIEHWRKLILPALQDGQWVICDRFSDSTIAYQAYGYQRDIDEVQSIIDRFLPDAIPHCTIILDADVDLALARARARNIDQRFESMDTDFHKRVRDGFRQIAKANPARCKIIDATRDIDTIGQVIWGEVRQMIA